MVANPALYQLRDELNRVNYLADEGLATALFVAMRLGRPLLLEGVPGVGKSTAAGALAASLHTPLIRLQCFEGITASDALYDWNHAKQLVALRQAGAADGPPLVRPSGDGPASAAAELFTQEFLVEGPLLRAVRYAGEVPAVLLIDEVDRAGDAFEARLAQFLGETSVAVPEIGTFVAQQPPIVIVTSDHSRNLHDALKRRCHYHWVEYPSADRAAEIVLRRVAGAAAPLVEAATAFVADVRALDLDKAPGLDETIDWVAAMSVLGLTDLDRDVGRATLGSIAKSPADAAAIGSALDDLPGAS